ncbi:methyltransferase domain-containing protein, partial [Patescibacteria group bacterium]|nr:methyltransferase domain-containing protein [Patescibacteria group bacterium]
MFKFGGTVDKKIKEIVENLPKGGRVLDLGSGLGANSIFLSKHGFKVVCLDKDEQVFKKIK